MRLYPKMALRSPIPWQQLQLLRRSTPSQHGLAIHRPFCPTSTLLRSFHSSPNHLMKVRKPGSFSTIRFTASDIPPLSHWESLASQTGNPITALGLTPEACLSTMQQYVSIAPTLQQRPLPTTLAKDKLHSIAVLIITGPPNAAWPIALHMLNTLVSLSYTPSILTMARLGFRTHKLGEPQFYPARCAFDALARKETDPNACTLQGLILAAQDTPATDMQALYWFRTAARLGGEVRGSWDWQAGCALQMGKVYLRQQEKDKARDIFRYVALELDVAEGCWLYATLLEHGEERKGMVLKAAVSGIQEAAREAARLEGLEMEKARQEGTLKGWEANLKGCLQKEWETIAGDRTMYEDGVSM
ncbi:uncharacterized protein BCR38DRAFT_419498 [Pseudomassariella vexata]|uniref:Uncharacterized protein n=1 Tax=Pseudomassariella vexata TaxID=1141098 RepID=A0A1Y2EDU8_9PEZI|nr:uncharacterized protein BCR38DRAFT_419498 [Pseudomassariella vexata]ORY69587.1 hypothetical protein BCR38DRAFT_419498 [Pseudomassariella vexata]